MKKKNIGKLDLHKSTIHNLGTRQALQVKGGLSIPGCVSIYLECWISYYASECPTDCETCVSCYTCLSCESCDCTSQECP